MSQTNSNLDPEEAELLDAFERGQLKRPFNRQKDLKRHRAYAKSTFKKDKRINVRISERDLNQLQKIASEEGMPYQTLVSSILHKYVEGRFVDKKSVQ